METLGTEMDVNQLSYEQALAELDGIVRELETGQGALEATLVLFERGQKLLQRCSQLLEAADLRLQVLSQDEELPESEA